MDIKGTDHDLQLEEIMKINRAERRAAELRRVRKNRAILAAVIAVVIAIPVALSSISKKDDAKKSEKNTPVTESKNAAAAVYRDDSAEDAEQEEKEEQPAASAENKTLLYYIENDVLGYEPSFMADSAYSAYDGYYEVESESDSAASQTYIYSGLYTGSVEEGGGIAINYKDHELIVDPRDALPVYSQKILPLGGISQFDEGTGGVSACPIACLYMLLENSGNEYDYYDMVMAAEYGGYANQGSLLEYPGGMTADALLAFAADTYGINMKNAYSDSQLPSETAISLLDSGKQIIALCVYADVGDAQNYDSAHFIVVTGYIKTGGHTYFIYADSYNAPDDYLGVPLKRIDAEIFDNSVSYDFNEPNALLYIENEPDEPPNAEYDLPDAEIE